MITVFARALILRHQCLCSPTIRNKAEGVKDTAESVKQALNDAGKAQAAAEKAIEKARSDIGLTQNRLAQVKQLFFVDPRSLFTKALTSIVLL